MSYNALCQFLIIFNDRISPIYNDFLYWQLAYFDIKIAIVYWRYKMFDDNNKQQSLFDKFDKVVIQRRKERILTAKSWLLSMAE